MTAAVTTPRNGVWAITVKASTMMAVAAAVATGGSAPGAVTTASTLGALTMSTSAAIALIPTSSPTVLTTASKTRTDPVRYQPVTASWTAPVTVMPARATMMTATTTA